MNMNRRGFLAGLFAVAAVAAIPIVWTARKLGFVNIKDFGAIGDGVTGAGVSETVVNEPHSALGRPGNVG